MNGELEFRAWDRESKCMRTVNSIEWSFEHARAGGVDTLQLMQMSATMAKPYEYPSPERGIIDAPVMYDITRPDLILMQYVGLKDINGRKIYVGDIVRWRSMYDNEVHITAIYTLKDFYEKIYFRQAYGDEEFYEDESQPEILGNVIENEDLIPTEVL